MYEGYVMLAKNARDVNVLKMGTKNIVGWLQSLRNPNRVHRTEVGHEESHGI
jgi:hypothetical protein